MSINLSYFKGTLFTPLDTKGCGYPADPDAILMFPGNVLVGPSDIRFWASESESEEGVRSTRTRAKRTRVTSRMAKDKQSRQLLRPSQPDDMR